MHPEGCDDDNLENGELVLKAGTKQNQHLVGIKTRDGVTQSNLVYVVTRGSDMNSGGFQSHWPEKSPDWREALGFAATPINGNPRASPYASLFLLGIRISDALHYCRKMMIAGVPTGV